MFLDLEEVSKDAVSHSSPKGTKVRKRDAAIATAQGQFAHAWDPAQSFPRLVAAGLPLYFWISWYFHSEQGLRQNTEIRLLSSLAFFLTGLEKSGDTSSEQAVQKQA